MPDWTAGEDRYMAAYRGESIDDVPDATDAPTCPHAERLMAAAPELLAALERAVMRLQFLHGLTHERMGCGYIDNAHWIGPAVAAIRKAKVAS